MTPTQLAIISILIGISPLLIALLGSLLARLLGCEQKGGGVSKCYFCGKDIGGILYGMMMMHWLVIITGGIAIFGITASLLWTYVSLTWAIASIVAPFALGLVGAILSYIPILTGFRAVDIQLSPVVSGILTDNNKPVAGATIVRYLEYGSYNDNTAITDDDGNFSFPAHNIRSLRPGWFAERSKPTLAKHGIFLRQQDDHINLFSWQSHYSLLQHPLSQVLTNLQCDLAQKSETYVITSTVKPLYVSALCKLPPQNVIPASN
ncbi:carboxypeptidase-like regulatory domain-containing protein [Shewanella baltica]|uniref:carboxypeptidase-like regulatory domain-containing protein n=1 Tax=Shewanella baltica TaxID=62322 RepID=UPI00217DC9E9|nr:carboxypeptidase-like regulatory domain-containing protein [Shewanella baltica]MCS6177989.1 carboxypeptidase regulatory-like domain-containing protein [Shewanella baltica]MCS6254135.1 carboxypeptidase regulatory-like domain-containing protein [Shewanella baltica]